MIARAADCSISKQFQLKHSQTISEVANDEAGAPLPGLDIQLTVGKNVFRQVRTENDGRYNFSEVPAGQYRIRVSHGNHDFCAPRVHCSKEECKFEARLKVNAKNKITVY